MIEIRKSIESCLKKYVRKYKEDFKLTEIEVPYWAKGFDKCYLCLSSKEHYHLFLVKDDEVYFAGGGRLKDHNF